MGYRHTKEEILDGALAAAFDEGLSQLTFGRLAKRLGVSDRIVVYYFPTKTDMITAVVAALTRSRVRSRSRKRIAHRPSPA